MKKLYLKIILATCLLFIFSLNVFAETDVYNAGKDIYDNAELFSSDAETEMTNKIKKLESKYGYDIAVVTCLDEYVVNPQYHADKIFDENNMGFGEHNNGILLVINMSTRDITISTSEPNSNIVFTQKVIDKILDRVAPKLTDKDYDAALRLFVKMVEPRVKEGYQRGNNSIGYMLKNAFFSIWTLFASIIFGIVWMLPKIGLHKPVKLASEAGSYEVAGSYVVNSKRDDFVSTHTTKHKIEKSSSSSGGSSHSRSSGGGTHRGGGSRKF